MFSSEAVIFNKNKKELIFESKKQNLWKIPCMCIYQGTIDHIVCTSMVFQMYVAFAHEYEDQFYDHMS